MYQQHINRRQFLGASAALSVAGTAGARSLTGAQSAPVNEKIAHPRKVALNLLKPSQKELDHGLELHAQSVVFDAYGFSPSAALDGDAIRAAMEAGASDIELNDMREEMGMTRCVTDPAEREEYIQAWEASGVTCIFQNAGEEGQDGLRMLKRAARFTFVTDMMSNFIQKAVRPDDVVAAKKNNRRCLYFSSNGVPLTQAWISVEDELRYVRVFFQLGFRMMHLTYNRRNMIGDGCGEPSNAGLSDFGRTVVAELNRIGVIADVAHSGWQTSLEAAKVSARPMVASHSGCAAVNNHYRCKPDEVIRAIVDTGGYIGICCVPGFLGRSGDINALLDHIDHVAKVFGVDHVGIGTDVVYASRNADRERKKIPSRPSRPQFRSLWPPYSFETTPDQALSLSWTNWPLFTVGLVQRGYSDTDIQKIIGGNVLRVARAVLPEELRA
jgi:membrane dipeptidase